MIDAEKELINTIIGVLDVNCHEVRSTIPGNLTNEKFYFIILRTITKTYLIYAEYEPKNN